MHHVLFILLIHQLILAVREIRTKRRGKKERLKKMDKGTREGQTAARRLKGELKDDKEVQVKLKAQLAAAQEVVRVEESLLLGALEKRLNNLPLEDEEQQILDWLSTMKMRLMTIGPPKQIMEEADSEEDGCISGIDTSDTLVRSPSKECEVQATPIIPEENLQEDKELPVRRTSTTKNPSSKNNIGWSDSKTRIRPWTGEHNTEVI